MTAEQLRNSLLQEAISGRLVPQDPNDEPASFLVENIYKERKALLEKGVIKKRDYKVYEITEDEVPFEIPSSWEWVKLGNIASFISDGTHKTPKYTNAGIPFLSVQNISSGKLDLSKIKYISEEEHSSLIKRVNPSINDILFCRIGTLGKAIKIDWDFDFSIFVSLGLVRLVDFNLTDYVVKVINSPVGWSWIQENKVGGGTHTYKINLGDLPNMLIPLPPLAEQKRIVAKLEELLPIVEEYGKSQKDLEKLNLELPARLRQSILQEAISGRLVPQAPNDNAESLLNHINERRAALVKAKIIENKYGKELQIDADEYDVDLPKGWVICKLGNIAKITAGGTPARGIHKYWAGGNIPWLKIADITSSGKYVNSASEYITEEGVKNSSAKLMKKGTLLYTIFASIGEVAILNFEATCNQAIANIDLYEPEMTEYIYYYLKNLQAYMYSISKGCAQLNINQDILKNAIVPLPPLDEQKRIVAKLEEILPQIDKLGKL